MKARDTELVRAWVAKLRDPNTSQTFSTLRSESGAVCALGALCEAAGDMGLGEWVRTQRGWVFQVGADEGHTNYPPRELMDRAFGSQEAWATYEGRWVRVFRLNDGDRLPFSEIADLVEAEYL